ncbi:LysR substrate-binding domain-containing protein [Marinomonas shanghaiensis]|uniref:LysR substrate-binding domain-containing protein n=1 Tax=Marinomonas shanghaiensis TaxID=2202418 RepID=UPI003A925955
MKDIKLTHLPLVALRAFESAGRLGTMTAASDELCVTPGAVSRQVRQLETLLGVALFSGPKNKPRLTEQGLLLLPIVSSAMSQMLLGLNTIRLTNKKTVTVSCLNTFAIRCLIPRMYRFNLLYPDIDIQLSTTSVDYGRDGYDVVIGVMKVQEGKNLDDDILFHEQIGPVMTEDVLASHSINKVEDLTAIDILLARTRLEAWDAWCGIVNNNIVPMSKRKFDHLYFVLEAALGGLGFCITPRHLVIDDLKAKRLIAPFGFVDSGYSYVIHQADKNHDNSIQFVQWLKKECWI